MYKVKTEKFEGPLELLLDLIEQEKLDITEISLSTITDRYLNEVSRLDPKIYDVAEFMIVAAKLIYIKSKALLPSLQTAAEEEEIEDLKQKLEIYKRYREAAKEFGNILARNQRSFTPKKPKLNLKSFVPPKGVALDDLWKVFNKLLKDMPEELKREEIEIPTEKLTVEQQIGFLEGVFKKEKKQKLSKLIKKCKTKLEAIITFLAILELVKCRKITVNQSSNFKEVELMGLI